MIACNARFNFARSRTRRIAAVLAVALLGDSVNETGKAASDAALSPPAGAALGVVDRGRPRVVMEAGPHHRLWQPPRALSSRTEPPVPADGYVELAAGLNRWDAKVRAWQPAEARFERHQGGHFLVRSAQYQVIIAPDLNAQAAVDLVTPDGVRLRSTVLGLALIDASSGRSVLVAELQACQGTLVSPTEVRFRNAFDGMLADVRYVIALDRFEQDVIVRERIPTEVVADLGMDPAQTRLLVLTEFFEPPQPARTVRQTPLPDGRSLVDEEISFGAMSIGSGWAWPAGTDSLGFLVHKSWELIEGRQLLIEAVPYAALFAMSEKLPIVPPERLRSLKARVRRTAGVGTPEGPGTESGLDLPGPRQARSRPASWESDGPEAESVQPSTAQTVEQTGSPMVAEGVIIDYPLSLYFASSDFVFNGDTTYYVTGTLQFSGTTTIEGGSVIKFAPSSAASIVLQGPVTCRTGPYRPAILTARDDDSVGSVLPGSTGQPMNAAYAQPALQIMRTGQTLHDLRIAHAQTGILFHSYSAGSNSVRHVQFVRCGTALRVNGYGITQQRLALQNVLIHGAAQAVAGYSFTAHGEHVTVCEAGDLAIDTQQGYPPGAMSSLSLVNSLLVAVQRLGNASVSQSYCQSATHSNLVFQTVGAGGFYLARSSWWNSGTANISPTLAHELKQKTTAPPTIRTGPTTADLVFAPSARRDVEARDPGYHYDPIDVAVGELGIAGGRTVAVVPDTTVAVFGPFGLRLGPSARLAAQGEALRPARFLRYNLVQEQPLIWGSPSSTPTSIAGTDQTSATAAVAPSASFRFVEFLASATPGSHVRSDGSTSRFALVAIQDSQLRGGALELADGPGSAASLQNSLFERVSVSLRSLTQAGVHNGLFRGGTVVLDRPATAGSWTIRDTAFHEVDLRDLQGGITHSHIAYLGNQPARLGGAGSNNLGLAVFPYSEGPLGPYYHVVTNLLNAGSRGAHEAGLYHHTTQASQTKETKTVVDIGYHYLAMELTGSPPQPPDGDRDGLPDYAEDANGSGAVDSGETDWRDDRDLGLRVRVARPGRSAPTP